MSTTMDDSDCMKHFEEFEQMKHVAIWASEGWNGVPLKVTMLPRYAYGCIGPSIAGVGRICNGRALHVVGGTVKVTTIVPGVGEAAAA